MHFDPEDQRERSSRALSMTLRRERRRQGASIIRRTFGRIASGCRRMADRIGTEMSSRRYIRLLATFDDRMLADIGITRHEIPAAVRSVAERRRRIRNAP